MSLPASPASPRTSPVTVFFSPALMVPSRSLWVEGDFLRLALSATVIWKDVTGVTSTPPPPSSPPSLIRVRAAGAWYSSGGAGASSRRLAARQQRLDHAQAHLPYLSHQRGLDVFRLVLRRIIVRILPQRPRA